MATFPCPHCHQEVHLTPLPVAANQPTLFTSNRTPAEVIEEVCIRFHVAPRDVVKSYIVHDLLPVRTECVKALRAYWPGVGVQRIAAWLHVCPATIWKILRESK